MENKEFFSTTEVAGILGISRTAVFNKIKSGKIKADKIGRNYLIKASDNPQLALLEIGKTDKNAVKFAVKKAVEEYGEAIKMLGRE